MSLAIRTLNEIGIQEFHSIIDRCTDGEVLEITEAFLTSEEFTDEFPVNIELDRLDFNSKKDLIQHLDEKLGDLDDTEIFYNSGLWSWLSAFYFDSVCPKNETGARDPKAHARHILNIEQWNRYYRHLIAAPYRLYKEIGARSELYLYGSSNVHPDIFEQLASAREIAANPGVIEAAHILYWDYTAQAPKYGSTSRNRRGSIRRFARSVIPQFQMTYDLNSMSGQEIVDLLPDEFNDWVS